MKVQLSTVSVDVGMCLHHLSLRLFYDFEKGSS
jgi:hypothetical protein